MTGVVVRPATAADAATIVGLVRELAEFERAPEGSVRLTEADIRRDGFGPNPRFEALLAEIDGAVEGLTVFFPIWSTWEGRAGLYVEDLYVRPRARRRGVGRRRLAEIAALAAARGCVRIDQRARPNPARARERLPAMRDWRPIARRRRRRLPAEQAQRGRPLRSFCRARRCWR
jgi:GNAT superfamily N-acetyltransferase